MELMRRYNDLVYPGVHPYDPLLASERARVLLEVGAVFAVAAPKPSDISHDFHSMYLSLIVEGVVGLTPRVDDRIELEPMARALALLPARSACATAATTSPSSGIAPTARCATTGYPEGFSLYIDDVLAFTRPEVGHVIYDPVPTRSRSRRPRALSVRASAARLRGAVARIELQDDGANSPMARSSSPLCL